MFNWDKWQWKSSFCQGDSGKADREGINTECRDSSAFKTQRGALKAQKYRTLTSTAHSFWPQGQGILSKSFAGITGRQGSCTSWKAWRKQNLRGRQGRAPACKVQSKEHDLIQKEEESQLIASTRLKKIEILWQQTWPHRILPHTWFLSSAPSNNQPSAHVTEKSLWSLSKS